MTYIKFNFIEENIIYVAEIHQDLSKDEIYEIEDAIVSYASSDEEYNASDMMMDVLNSFNFKWNLIQKEANIQIQKEFSI